MEENKEQHTSGSTHKKSKKSDNSLYTKIILVIGIALIILAVFNIFQGRSFGILVGQKVGEIKEAAKPAKIELIIINDPNCDDCFDVSSIVDSIKSANVDITKEENLDMDSAKEIIDKYGIEKVPTVIISGEIDKIKINGLEEKEDVLVFTQLTPPYKNTKTNKIVGRVSATFIQDSSCNECTDLNFILDVLRQAGIKIVYENSLEYNSDSAKELIDEYAIEIAPTLILSKDLGDYNSEVLQSWSNIGSIESDGSYITRTINPPYIDLDTNELKGLVSITYLIDNSCSECYDAENFHKPVLQGMGVFLEKETKVDASSSEGKALIEKYGIEKLPTTILKGDIELYPALVGAWKEVGTVELDGAYVFRNVEIAQQPYKDLTTDEVVTPIVAAS